jgi:hypothetical protein
MAIASTLLAPPVPAQHGAECVCRNCAAGSHVDLLLRADYQRQELSRLADENAKLKQALAVSEFRRLTVVISLAIAKKDDAAWSRAVKERLSLGISDAQCAELLAEAA